MGTTINEKTVHQDNRYAGTKINDGSKQTDRIQIQYVFLSQDSTAMKIVRGGRRTHRENRPSRRHHASEKSAMLQILLGGRVLLHKEPVSSQKRAH